MFLKISILIGIYINYAQHSFRILAAVWLLASLVLVNSYSSIVVSSLTISLKTPPVNSFEDLAVNKDVALILHPDFVISKQILVKSAITLFIESFKKKFNCYKSATTGVLKILGDLTRSHPDRLLTDFPSLLKKLEDGQHAFSFVRCVTQNLNLITELSFLFL